MATSTWNGADGDWKTRADWTSDTPGDDVPNPGDTAVIASGTVILTTDTGPNPLFENNRVTLGGATGATLLLRDPQPAGRYFNVTIAGAATIEADGNRGFAGSITGTPNDGSTITLKADPGGNLVLLHGGSFNVADRVIDFEGNVTLERDAMVSGNIINNGTLSILSGRTSLATNSLTGTGTISIGGDGELALDGFQFGGATQTIAFAGAGGTLDLFYNTPGNFSGAIRDFAPGDFINFTGGDGSATSASLDTTAHTLTINSTSGQSYVFNNFYGAAGALTDVRLSNGRDLISYASAPTPLDVQIDAGARAMHADVAHQMTVPGTTTPITGAGVKIGIISNSFDVGGQAATDVANGYLPAAGVTVLQEGAAGEDDEGRAMAELIYQTAPGASLYFASTGSNINDFASSVRALQAAGCTVIVDDITFGNEPYFQLGSPAENAISDAIAAGVTYVSSAGNFGDAYYQHSFTTSQQTLYDGSVVQAMTFSNQTPYQSITATGGSYDYIDLEWDAPFYGTGGVAADQPGSVTLKLFDATTNALVATSTQVSVNGHLVAEAELLPPPSNATTTYNLAIYRTDGTPAPSEIKYSIIGVSPIGSTGVGGRINDPDAGVGSGEVHGHQLIPGVITVAASDVTNSSAFARSPDFAEYFSSTGPGTLLFDAAGNRSAQPTTVGAPDVTGPDGIQTSVTGFTPFFGTSAAAPNVAAVAALLQQVRPGISPASVASVLAQSAIPLSGESASVAGAGLVQADRAILLAEQVACYCPGTGILTDRGEVAIEDLAVGDLVVTASGQERAIAWLGRRTLDLLRHSNPKAVWPVRVAAGAFGGGRPHRDLWMSPGHSVLVDGILVPIRYLINGASVAQVQADRVIYWHLELDSHDAVLANGLPAETYMDAGSRSAFEAEGVMALHPCFEPSLGSTCAPLHKKGPQVAAVRTRLLARAERLGHAITTDADLHLIADERRIDPVSLGRERFRFDLPGPAADIRLVSRRWVPAQHLPDSGDWRDLGICLGELTLDGAVMPLDGLGEGWHKLDRNGSRWSDGAGRLPNDCRRIELALCGRRRYWMGPAALGRAAPGKAHAFN